MASCKPGRDDLQAGLHDEAHDQVDAVEQLAAQAPQQLEAQRALLPVDERAADLAGR